MPPSASLYFTATPDLSTYYPSDYVNLKIVTYSSSTNTPLNADTYINFAVTDKYAYYGLPGKIQSGGSLAYKLYVENEFPFPTYATPNYYKFLDQFSNGNVTAYAEALIATQLYRPIFSDLVGFYIIEEWAHWSAGPNFI